jgi:hypothetical protein
MVSNGENYQNFILSFQKIIGQDKKYLFGLIGFISGLLGALVAEITIRPGTSYVFQVFIVALWAGVFATVISLGLHWAIDVYSRRKTNLGVLLKKAVPMGFIAGAVSGVIAQSIFGLNLYYVPWIDFAFRAVCWGILGCILGAGLSYAIPNLGMRRAVIAGVSGGVIGGVGFQLVSLFFPETLGRMLGVGILGLALGLCLVIVEERSRSAFLEVHWAPNEISKFTLGSIPIYIGGGEDDVYISGIQHHAMSLVYQKGKVNGMYYVTGDKKELSDGSRIKLGKVEMFVRIVQK